jgi:hypothetical protein
MQFAARAIELLGIDAEPGAPISGGRILPATWRADGGGAFAAEAVLIQDQEITELRACEFMRLADHGHEDMRDPDEPAFMHLHIR